MKISKELEQYRPLTITEIVSKLIAAFFPWAMIGAAIGCAAWYWFIRKPGSSELAEYRAIVLGILSLGTAIIAFRLRDKATIWQLVDIVNRNGEKYCAVYKQPVPNGFVAHEATVLTSAARERWSIRGSDSGLVVVLPLYDDADGWAYVSPYGNVTVRDCELINEHLRFWKLKPLVLSKWDYNDVRFAVVDPKGESSLVMTLADFAFFALNMPFRVLDSADNTWVGLIRRLASIKDSCQRAADVAEDQAERRKAINERLFGALADLFKLKEVSEIHGRIMNLLLELLPDGDPRRPGAPVGACRLGIPVVPVPGSEGSGDKPTEPQAVPPGSKPGDSSGAGQDNLGG